MTELESLSGFKFVVTSGLRDRKEQLSINPTAKNSAHLSGEAVDVNDTDKSVFGWVIDHLEELIRLGLYVESKVYTPRHCHFTIRKPASGTRIFIP